jgi:hypothetical protein
MVLAVAALAALSAWQMQPGVSGRVVDATGQPLPGATVSVSLSSAARGGELVAISSDDGSFTLPVLPARTRLLIRLPGFRPEEVTIDPAASRPLVVTLRIANVEETVEVRAPASGTIGAALPLTPLDVVRTPGTQADLMRAIAGLPGVAHIDEGAGLFVRGGDVSELVVYLDGVIVTHPYRYETPTGGFRGAIDPFLIQGASFSSGAFSAAYGNSLSAVVDLAGPERPTARQMTVTAGLAGVSMLAATPVGSKWGLRAGGNRATPSLLFAVNPAPRDFDQLPGGWDVSAGVQGELAGGRLRGFILAQADHVGVELEKDAFVGFLHSLSEHQLVTLRWERPLGAGWHVTASAGSDSYASGTDVGVLDLVERERNHSGRVAFAGPARSWTVQAGADADVRTTRVAGEVPLRGGDFGGVSGFSGFAVEHRDDTAGVFGLASRPFGRLTPELGVRLDRYDSSDAWTADPRVAVRLELPGARRLRLAVGRHHQGPSPAYFDRLRGATRLPPLEATHVVAGYERGQPSGPLFMRLEAYYKRYDALPLEHDEAGFAPDGYGFARGLDYYFRTAWSGFELKLSASLLDAERRWTSPTARDRHALPAGTWTPDFEIPYAWQLVTNVPLGRGVSAGLTWRVAAGRPTTPVLGATATPTGFVPVWGEINADRLPRYERLDLSVSLLRNVGRKALVILFASGGNVLGRRNFFEYAYSADYSERRPVVDASPRSVYVGCSITR